MNLNVKSTEFLTQIISGIQKVAGGEPVALHEPTFDGNEWKYLQDCLDSTYVSSIGDYVEKFEEALASYTSAKFAVAVVNGTEALHIALKLADVLPGDEVLVPALTFIATANAVSYCGGIPHFVDCEISTLGIDVEKLRKYLKKIAIRRFGSTRNKNSGQTIKALVPMHTFGHPSNLDALIEIANEFDLVIVEDAAESLGSTYKNRHTGTFGLLGALSFNGNKVITTGGGGAILTSNEELAKRAKHLTRTARISHKWDFMHDEIGFNFRMPNINAALGLAQLERLNFKLNSKRSLFIKYKEALSSISGVRLFEEPKYAKSNYWLQTIILDTNRQDLRDEVLEQTNNLGIMTRPTWKILNELAPYKNHPSMDLSFAKSISKRIINIPSSSKLAKTENYE